MKDLELDFIIHWLYVIVFGLLFISGLTLMGAKFGWLINYNLSLSDYIHRTMAAVLVILLLVAIVVEILRISKTGKPTPWLIVKKSSMGIITIINSILFLLSGVFIWLCMEFSHQKLAFALMVHDLLALIWVPTIIWHIYEKAHGLPPELGGKKSVSKKLV